MRKCALLLLAVTAPIAAVSVAGGADPPWIARGVNGIVASDSAQASEAGIGILESGGNAVDAAAAVSFALAVTRPYSTGLGGGGFMIARFADGRIVVQDFRETAPSAATPEMYVDAAKAGIGGPVRSQVGYLAVAVPGLVAGRCQALAQFGTMPLAQVIVPAAQLAKAGFPVDGHYVEATRKVLKLYERNPPLKESCSYVYETHLRRGRLRAVGERLVQPQLGGLLEGIARSGPNFFYHGPVAEAIAREMKTHGGILTEKDLASYQVRRREPVRSTYREYEIIGMPPPSSGGITLAEILNILETVDLSAESQRDPALAVHYQIEAMRHAFADRARWLGDSDFTTVPVERLISKSYARQLAGRLNPDGARAIADYGTVSLPDDGGTSHFCVVDRSGNVVVSTETINTSFGSLAAVGEWGLILNNEMDDFAAEPGVPNAFSLVHSERNAVAPGKRPLSSMSPTIVLKNGEPYLLLGASGGPRIITSVLNVLLSVTDFGLSLEQAMLAPRPHHQWQPDQVFFDTDPTAEMKKGLAIRGHQLSAKRKTGIVQAVLRDKDGWIGASDPRKGGRPAGY
jgi:gamma-glutamyltranspeptidase/glutathione hydrolase